MQRCLFCYEPLEDDRRDYHATCSRKMFGSSEPPELPYAEEDLEALALQVIRKQVSITGVQPKLSVDIEKTPPRHRRFTIVGLWGAYILKPPTAQYPFLPEVEDLTMHLASLARIPVVPHALIRMRSGSLAYITKRIDRHENGKLHMEDMCQLTERLTEYKYRGSHEQIARTIQQYSANPGLDVIGFCEQVLFSFLTGNADMHLKNFSLIDRPGIGYALAPGYDFVATALVNPGDTEELALTLNGKKRHLRRKDFDSAFNRAGVDTKVANSLYVKFARAFPAWRAFITTSFVPLEMQERFLTLLDTRAAQLGLNPG
ncbi:MAG: HipA domain-containing protein [Ignavibacteria bacterium]|nr:HipA domain-containing protein [Ignavibacteria bacterium]